MAVAASPSSSCYMFLGYPHSSAINPLPHREQVKLIQGSGSGNPPADCCNGVRALASAAATTADRQAACNCIKTASKNANINLALAKALPGNCGINLGYAIDPSVDCSTIK